MGDEVTKEIFKDNYAANSAKKSVFLGDISGKDASSEIAIIQGLSAENSLMRIEKRLMGFRYSYSEKIWIKYRDPIMNNLGIGNFMAALQALSDNTNFSNFEKEQVPKLTFLFFQQNYPNMTIYHEEFELKPKDFNVIKTVLLNYALSIFSNAKNAGHRNVVRGTLSENVLGRMFGGQSKDEVKKRGFLEKIQQWGKR